MRRLKMSLYGTLGLISLILILVNFIGSRFYFRWDSTNERIYSISEGSKKIATGFSSPVQIKLYFSNSAKEVPPAFKSYGKRVIEVFKIYQASNRKAISIEVIDPQPDSNEEEFARKSGLQAVRLPTGSDYFLGVVLSEGDRESIIPYLDLRREEFLEYEIAEAFLKLQTKQQKKVALISSFNLDRNENSNTRTFDARMGSDWAIAEALAKSYDVTIVKETAEQLPDNLAAVVVLHPKEMTEKLRYALDQYLMQGGHLFIAIDPFSRVQLALSAGAMQSGQIPKFSSNFSPWLEKWGVSYNDAELLGDRLLATPINAGGENISYPFFMSLLKQQGNMNANHPVTHQLNHLVIAEGGLLTFDPLKNASLKWTPLIETTKNSGTSNAAMAAFVRPGDLASGLKASDKIHTIAALLNGPLPSAFEKAPAGVSGEFLNRAKDGAAVIIIADTDMFHDANAVDRIQVGAQIIMKPRNDNVNFLLNSVDLLAGGSELLSIRKSGSVTRPFTRVHELQQKAGEKWRAEEEKLSKQLAELQSKLQQLQAQRSDNNRLIMSPEQEQEIARFRSEEATISKKRRAVRKNLREDIEKLGHGLALLNLTVTPLAIGIGGILFYRFRTRRRFSEVAAS